MDTLTRAFDVRLEPGDGRTLDAKIVPYNVETTVADPPDFRPYREVFEPGAFERQVAAAGRAKTVDVWLNFEHNQGIGDILGHGVELREAPDGLYGTFEMHDNPDGNKALELVRRGLLPGLSIEFRSKGRPVNGVMHRHRAHLDAVALCRFPAYPGAEVLALREQPFVREPEPPMDPALVARLEALGVVVAAVTAAR